MTDLRPESQKKIDEAYLDYPNPGDFPEFDAGKYGITEFKQAIANAEVGAVLGSGSAAEFGTKIDAATMPTGGTGNLGWLSAIWKLISDRIPALSNGKIPVEVGSLNVSVSNASLEIANDAGNPIPISDAGGSITVDGTFWQATQPVSAASLPLPTGAATAAKQPALGIAGTASTDVITVQGIAGGVAQPVTIATLPALATGTNTIGAISNTSFAATQSGTWNVANITGTVSLPTGAATSANQSTTNTSLASIDTKTPALGQALASGSTPVVLPSAMVTDLKAVNITGTLPAFAATPTVNIGTAPNLTFTNTSFTANAGTNLNTSALALESGGNLAGINTKLPSGLTVSSTRLLVDGSGVTQPVSLASVPAGLAYESTVTITRAANTTAYVANDVYGNSANAVFQLTNIGASGGYVFLNYLGIIFNITALPSGMGAFAVYLYSGSPPSAIADNSPFSIPAGDTASILNLNGIILTASLARGGGRVVAEALNINQLFKLATGQTSLWGYLVTLGAFTPAANSETATICARSFAP